MLRITTVETPMWKQKRRKEGKRDNTEEKGEKRSSFKNSEDFS